MTSVYTSVSNGVQQYYLANLPQEGGHIMDDLQQDANSVIRAIYDVLDSGEVDRIDEETDHALRYLLENIRHHFLQVPHDAEMLLILQGLLHDVRQIADMEDDEWDELSVYSHESSDSGYGESISSTGSVVSEHEEEEFGFGNNEVDEADPEDDASRGILPPVMRPIEVNAWINQEANESPSRKRSFIDAFEVDNHENDSISRRHRRCEHDTDDIPIRDSKSDSNANLSKKRKPDDDVDDLRRSASASDVYNVKKYKWNH